MQDPVAQPADTAASMTVALVGGTGKLGSALAARLVTVGHRVVIGSRDGARAAATASALARSVDEPLRALMHGTDNAAAAADADIVVITVPFAAQQATVAGLAGAVGERVVVSTAVPLRFDGRIPAHVDVPEGSASEQVAALLPRARVIGALHTVSSVTLARVDRAIDADVIITGDDATAKAIVARLLDSLPSLRAVDGGALRNSRYVEQLAVLLLSINMRVRRNTGVRITNLPDRLALAAAPPPAR